MTQKADPANIEQFANEVLSQQLEDEMYFNELYSRAIRHLLKNGQTLHVKHPVSGDSFTITHWNGQVWCQSAQIEGAEDGVVYNEPNLGDFE